MAGLYLAGIPEGFDTQHELSELLECLQQNGITTTVINDKPLSYPTIKPNETDPDITTIHYGNINQEIRNRQNTNIAVYTDEAPHDTTKLAAIVVQNRYQQTKLKNTDTPIHLISPILNPTRYDFQIIKHQVNEFFRVTRLSTPQKELPSNVWIALRNCYFPSLFKIGIIKSKRIPNLSTVELITDAGNIPDTICNSHCLIQIGNSDGIDRTAMIAMALGIPVVAQNDFVWKDLIHHRETGLLCNNPEELTHLLTELATNDQLRIAIAQNARDYVTTLHQNNAQNSINQWISLLDIKPQQRKQYTTLPILPKTGLLCPYQHQRIQIEITNACPHRCSNCSRLTAHIKKPFFMDFQTFQNAVLSMEGYQGMLGIMGGEPTIHPEFDKFVRYFKEHWHPEIKHVGLRQPLTEFPAFELSRQRPHTKHGLWTSFGAGYYKHFELIQDTFPYQCTNDHNNLTNHQPILISREDLGIPDEEWLQLRNNCWLQRQWSSSITPKGAFFCEVAAALDMLYDGPGGWPVEKGWWKRSVADFGDQLRWCELCGIPISTKPRPANDSINDVSSTHLPLLRQIQSPALKSGKIAIYNKALHQNIKKGSPLAKHTEWYLTTGQTRISKAKAPCPQHIDVITVSVNCGDELRRTIKSKITSSDKLTVVTTTADTVTQNVAKAAGAELVITDACYQDGDAFNKGRMLNEAIKHCRPTDWVILTDVDIYLPPNLLNNLKSLILNPGCLYYTRRHTLPEEYNLDEWDITKTEYKDLAENNHPWGYFQLFNIRASALQGNLEFPDCFCSAGSVDTWFQSQWDKAKRISLPISADHRYDVIHISHGELTERWNGSRPTQGWRWVAQHDLSSRSKNLNALEPPCWIRRIDIYSLEQDTILYSKPTQNLVWPTVHRSTPLYEYSSKPLTQEEMKCFQKDINSQDQPTQ